ncbi:MAG: hypothetical protein JW862_07595 [Anaerolineales bacterium]|nr:hypothetical protein [Anaerolineales bacterium]
MTFIDFLQILASLLRALGMLVFGVGAGWFVLYAFRQPERRWQLQIAVFLGFFFFTALAARFTSAAGIGGFTLGAGAALLFWGLRPVAKKESDEKQQIADDE